MRVGQAERLPFDEGTFDVVLAQLVVNFMSDPQADRIEGHETRVVVRGPSADDLRADRDPGTDIEAGSERVESPGR